MSLREGGGQSRKYKMGTEPSRGVISSWRSMQGTVSGRILHRRALTSRGRQRAAPRISSNGASQGGQPSAKEDNTKHKKKHGKVAKLSCSTIEHALACPESARCDTRTKGRRELKNLVLEHHVTRTVANRPSPSCQPGTIRTRTTLRSTARRPSTCTGPSNRRRGTCNTSGRLA
jgi:hypothetical protein